jgi:hypothetical protein
LHDDALAQWTIGRDGVSHAPIAVTLGPDLMASDGFHPGEPLYRLCGQALATHVTERVWPRLLEETTP